MREVPTTAAAETERPSDYLLPASFEDPDSNVFHKAIVFDPAVGAYLKTWRPAGESLSATTLRHGRFGGRFDRLRDVEIGDVTGDGEADIAIATHDQGIVTRCLGVGARRERLAGTVRTHSNPDLLT